MAGLLQATLVRITDQSEGDRIHSKGRYGRPLSGGGLELDLLEAAYLCEVDRLEVRSGGHILDWAGIIVEGSRLLPGFEVDYMAYRDLRERGYTLRATAPHLFHVWAKGGDRKQPPMAWLAVASEREECRLRDVQRFVADARAKGVRALWALVDEESDLTHYELSDAAPKGGHTKVRDRSAHAVLLADRALVADAETARHLHEEEFLGRPVGQGLQLSLVETAHLAQAGRLRVQDAKGKELGLPALKKRIKEVEPLFDLRLRCYEDLRARGLLVKTGFKFGTHFRCYDQSPDEEHAPYLVQAVAADHETSWETVARAVRLGHSVRKTLLFALVGPAGVDYLSFGRHRP